MNVDERTVRRWCESGKLAARSQPYGIKTTYLISHQAVDLLAETQRAKRKPIKKNAGKPHKSLTSAWKVAMAKGFITGKPYSKRTIDDYVYYIDQFFRTYRAVSLETLKSSLAAIPTAQTSKRQHCYKAIVCFGKFLVREGALEEAFLAEVKSLYPKAHKPPKRHTVTLEQLQALLSACENAMETALIVLIANTGIRASELCKLKWEDVDLERGQLTIHHGKGNKPRKVGLGLLTVQALQAHHAECASQGSIAAVFINIKARPMDRQGLYQRLERIGKKAAIIVSPHALRRAFVTVNANKGRPLQMLQIACGHSSIKTTMAYCQTAEQEVIKAMREWN